MVGFRPSGPGKVTGEERSRQAETLWREGGFRTETLSLELGFLLAVLWGEGMVARDPRSGNRLSAGSS